MAATYTVHTYAGQQRKIAHPMLDGTHLESTHGYVYFKHVVISWATYDEIETIINNAEGADYTRMGEYRLTPAINEHLGLYNTEVLLVKYAAK